MDRPGKFDSRARLGLEEMRLPGACCECTKGVARSICLRPETLWRIALLINGRAKLGSAGASAAWELSVGSLVGKSALGTGA